MCHPAAALRAKRVTWSSPMPDVIALRTLGGHHVRYAIETACAVHNLTGLVVDLYFNYRVLTVQGSDTFDDVWKRWEDSNVEE